MTAAALAGCQTARVAHPLTIDHGGNDDFEQLEFWHSLAGRPVTSNDEAFHGLLLFLDGTDPSGDYAARVAQLRSRRLLPPGYNQPADQAVDRGTLAVAIVRALKIEGGVSLRLLGATPLSSRYRAMTTKMKVTGSNNPATMPRRKSVS